MLIQAALNGTRTGDDNPGVPISPAELAFSAKDAVAAGARELHFHVRALNGRESVAASDVASAVEAVRTAVPSIRFGVSTGLWILPDAAHRHAAVAQWKVLPDYASVNFKEEGAVELGKLILGRGMGIEAGFTDPRGTEEFLASGLAPRCLRVLLEPLEPDFEAAIQTIAAIEAALDRGGVKIPRLLHGFNQTAWAVIDAAAARGYDTRVGFEDILTLPNGAPATSNAALVSEALRRTRAPA
jgi:uncharacterized protein (DUF849 family)